MSTPQNRLFKAGKIKADEVQGWAPQNEYSVPVHTVSL